MQNLINKIAEILQKDMNYEDAGLAIAMAAAKDGMSYNDAYCKIHLAMDSLKHAEKYLANAAFKELAVEGKRINPEHMGNPKKYY